MHLDVMAEIDKISGASFSTASQRRKVGTKISNSLTIGQSKKRKVLRNNDVQTRNRSPEGSTHFPSEILLGGAKSTSKSSVQIAPSKLVVAIIGFCYQYDFELLELKAPQITQGVDFSDNSWFSKLAMESYNTFRNKLYDRVPSESQRNQGIPSIPPFDERWAKLGQVINGEPTDFSSDVHLQNALERSDKRSNHTKGLYVKFDADEYIRINEGEDNMFGRNLKKRDHDSTDNSGTDISSQDNDDDYAPKRKRLHSPSNESDSLQVQPGCSNIDTLPNIDDIFGTGKFNLIR
jgi:hypothetical protein